MAVSEAELARRISAIRHARSMTQHQLATAAGVSRETIHALEAARPATIKTMMLVATALGVKIVDLLGDERPRLPPPRPPEGPVGPVKHSR